MNAEVSLTKRELGLIVAALMSVEDAEDSFNVSLRVVGEAPAGDKEVCELGERLIRLQNPHNAKPS